MQFTSSGFFSISALTVSKSFFRIARKKFFHRASPFKKTEKSAYFPFFLFIARAMSFSSSTSGIIATASARATANSFRLMVSKPNAVANAGTKMTAEVSAKASSSEPQSQPFCFFIVNTERSRERILKAWKSSTSESVKNAMVMPSGLSVIPHFPASIKCPTK